METGSTWVPCHPTLSDVPTWSHKQRSLEQLMAEGLKVMARALEADMLQFAIELSKGQTQPGDVMSEFMHWEKLHGNSFEVNGVRRWWTVFGV